MSEEMKKFLAFLRGNRKPKSENQKVPISRYATDWEALEAMSVSTDRVYEAARNSLLKAAKAIKTPPFPD